MSTSVYPLLAGNPNFTFPVVLTEIEYSFNIKWNFRELAWYLSIRDITGNDLVSNIKIVPMVDLLGNYLDKTLPSGTLIFIPINYPKLPPITYDNLSTDYLFTYIEV